MLHLVAGHAVVEDGGQHDGRDQGDEERGAARARAREPSGKERILTCRVLPSRGDRVPPAFLHFPLDGRARDRLPRHAAGRPHRPADLLRRDGRHPLGHLDLRRGRRSRSRGNTARGLQIFARRAALPVGARALPLGEPRSGRLFGAGTLAGAVLLGRALGGARVGGWPGSSTSRCPYALVYDRLALTDPALATFAIFVAVFCLRLVARWRVQDGLLPGAGSRSWPCSPRPSASSCSSRPPPPCC